MKRIIYIILLAAMLISTVGGVSVFAAYDGENLTRDGVYLENTTEGDGIVADADLPTAGDTDYLPEDESYTGGEVSDGTDSTPEGGTDNPSTDSTDSPLTDGEVNDSSYGVPTTDTDGAEEDVATNPFAEMFDTVKAYATEIFCSLTFVGSILLAYAYKKGLIPLLQGGISTISGTVSKIKESTERGESKTDELSRVITDRLTDAEVCLDGIATTLGELNKKLEDLRDTEGETAKMKLVMSAQVDMLYSIFMTSSLPQYQKDEVGEKVRAMKEALYEDEGR